MKVAISASGNNLEALLDSRFGRCSYFVIYDMESRSVEFIPNPNKDAVEGAGPASVQLVASKGVKKVVSGEFGAKVKSLFDRLQIQLVLLGDKKITVSEIIKLLHHEHATS